MFGSVVYGEMHVNTNGCVVQVAWFDLPRQYPGVACDAFVVMPNHVHGVLVFAARETIASEPAQSRQVAEEPQPDRNLRPAPTLGDVVRGFKARVTRAIQRSSQPPVTPVWQRNYHDHVIRDEHAMNRIRQYITDNPRNWDADSEHPLASPHLGPGDRNP
jgi:putative transposase